MVERLLLSAPPPPKKKNRGGRPKGGPPGPGRPPGRRQEVSNEQRRAAARTGELPHQFLLRIMRMGPGAKIGNYILQFSDVMEAAKAAAPFYAAKLASIQIKPADKPPINVQLDPGPLAKLEPADLVKMLTAFIQASTAGIIDGDATPVINPDADIEDIDPSLYERTLQ